MKTPATFLFAACSLLASCGDQPAPPPPPPPASTAEVAPISSNSAQEAKQALANAGGALKTLAGDLAAKAKVKAGEAWDATKIKAGEFGEMSFNDILPKLESSLAAAKAKGSAAWDGVKAATPQAMTKLKQMIASLPEDKREAAKAKLQRLQDILDGKIEPTETPAP
jgi:hypothetical protein